MPRRNLENSIKLLGAILFRDRVRRRKGPAAIGGGGGDHTDVIVYIFVHLHTTLHTEGNMLDTN